MRPSSESTYSRQADHEHHSIVNTTRGGIVTGWGISVPDKVVTNDDLSVTMDTNDAWIRERTGIRERRIGGTTSQLAIDAGLAALEKAGRRPDEIDGVILATTTPDQIVPGTSATVQDGIGIPGGAFDVNAACSGFVYALTVAHGMLAIGAERLLVIGSETLSRITDWDDRSVAVLVGDGAGAVVLEAVDGPGQLLSWVLGSDGSLRHLLKCDHGGYLYMDGKEIFRKAVRAVVESSEQAIAEAGLTVADIDLMVPHQANLRIISAAAQRLGIPEEKAVVVIDRYGNTSSASIPLALVDALDTGRLEKGQHVLLTGFGGGMTWASAVLRWGG
jgi:3-oxoacyl-[acyl-carrier-protein] synthase-3